METEDRLLRKEEREQIEKEIQVRLSFLNEERERLYKDSRTGWQMALFCLFAGLAGMYFEFHLVAVAFFFFSAMGYIASKFDELKSEMARTKWDQVFFLERFVRHALTSDCNDVTRVRDQIFRV